MTVATSAARLEVGVRELKNHLSEYLDRVAVGADIVVTEHGRPVARLTALDSGDERLSRLIAAGALLPPADARRHRPRRRITASGTVSDLVTDQRA